MFAETRTIEKTGDFSPTEIVIVFKLTYHIAETFCRKIFQVKFLKSEKLFSMILVDVGE